MRRPLMAAFGGVTLIACAGPSGAGMAAEPDPARLRAARDGDIAIRQELAAARRAGTVAAYDLFIARHPDHALVRTARRERDTLASRAK